MRKSVVILMLSVAGLAGSATASAGILSDLLGLLHLHHDPGCRGRCIASAPEIDPASAFGALTLLGGGLLVLRGRNDKK